MTEPPVLCTYPPLEVGAALRGIARCLRRPAGLTRFIRTGRVDAGLLLLDRSRESRLLGAEEVGGGAKAVLAHLGRGALYLGCRVLASRCECPGPHSVAVPSYHCGSEIETLYRAGFVLRFYRVRSDLTVDTDSFAEASRGACFRYVVSFFGFPPLVEGLWPPAESDEVGSWLVVEDAAHALYSCYPDGTPVGSRSAVAIFSVRKSLGVPDGGALLVRGEEGEGAGCHFDACLPGTPPPGRRLRSVASQTLLALAAHPGATGRVAAQMTSRLSRTERAALAGELEEAVYAFEGGSGWELEEGSLRTAATRASLLTYMVLAGQFPSEAAAARRANYHRLLWEFGLGEFVPPGLDALPDGAVPLFLPVLTRDRRRAVASFYEAGIRVAEVWPVAHRLTDERFARELEGIRSSLLALPVHHELRAGALEKVGEKAAEVLSSVGAGAKSAS